MARLTARQKMIYHYIRDYTGDCGCAPSIDEIRQNFSLRSSATVHKHLDAMERRGALRRQRGLARALELIPLQEEQDKPVALPVVTDLTVTDYEGLPRLWVGEWMLPPNAAGGLLFANQGPDQDGYERLSLVVQDCLPPKSTAELVALVLDEHTSVVRHACWGTQVRIFPHGVDRPGFSVSSQRVRYVGRVVNQMYCRREG